MRKCGTALIWPLDIKANKLKSFNSFFIISFYSEGSVIAEVQNFYDLSSDATSASVEEKIDKSIKVYLSDATTYTRTSEASFDLLFCNDFEQFSNFKH